MIIKHTFKKWDEYQKKKSMCGSNCLKGAGLESQMWSVKAWLFLQLFNTHRIFMVCEFINSIKNLEITLYLG